MVTLQLIVGPPVGHSQVERFIPRAVVLHPECDADKPSRTRLGPLARKAGNFRLDGAVFEVGRLNYCENLAATYRSSRAIVIDNPHRPAPAIVDNICLNFYRISTWVGHALNFQPIHGIQAKRQNLRFGFVIISEFLSAGCLHILSTGDQKARESWNCKYSLLPSTHDFVILFAPWFFKLEPLSCEQHAVRAEIVAVYNGANTTWANRVPNNGVFVPSLSPACEEGLELRSSYCYIFVAGRPPPAASSRS
jgi:hypothetical protein